MVSQMPSGGQTGTAPHVKNPCPGWQVFEQRLDCVVLPVLVRERLVVPLTDPIEGRCLLALPGSPLGVALRR